MAAKFSKFYDGYELPDGRWRGSDCPRCGSARIYRDKYVADRNKKRESCEKCRGIIQINIGSRFGDWTVIDGPVFNGGCPSRPQGYVKWLCRCERCRNDVFVDGSNLRRGNSTRCSKCRFLPEGQANFNARYAEYKKRAIEKNLEWELDEAQFAFLVSQHCVYCGAIGTNNYNTKKGEFLSNGIDRIVSSSGYVLSNVVPCCKSCNYAKRKMSTRDFSQWASRLNGTPEYSDTLWRIWAARIRNILKILPEVAELDVWHEGQRACGL